MALAKKYSLKGRYYFRLVKRRGQSVNTPLFFANCLLRQDSLEQKVGIVVSKKVSKKAVARNRAKRLISESLRRQLPYLKKGFFLVIVGKRAMLGADLEEVSLWVERALRRLRLLEGETSQHSPSN